MRKLLHSIILISYSVCVFSQQNYLKKGQNISFGKGEFRIIMLSKSEETPSQKVKASEGNHYIIISLEITKIDRNAEYSSACFVLADNKNHKYVKPGSWGTIEIAGSKSNFEASVGATVFVRNQGEILNLIFEVPKTILPANVLLQYDEKCNDINAVEDKNDKIESPVYTIENIKLFERGKTIPNIEDRFYALSFYKEYSRYIAVEVSFKNNLYQEAKQEHAIEFVWYDSKGVVEGKLNGTVQIQSDWASSIYTSSGWGWKEPGKWTPGEYKVDIYIDNLKVSEKSFLIKEKEYRINSIKMFGFREDRPVQKNRAYTRTFNKDSIKFLSVEIGFTNLFFEKEHHEHFVMLKWFDSEGKFEGKQEGTTDIKPEWKASTYTSKGWGYTELGKWSVGEYMVEVYLDNKLIGKETYEVKNTEQITTETAAESNGSKVVIMQKPTEQQVYSSLIASGIQPVQAQILASLTAAKNTMVYKVGKTLFIGTEEQIKAGIMKLPVFVVLILNFRILQ